MPGASRRRSQGGSLDGLAQRCAVGLDALYSNVCAQTCAEPALVYSESIRYIVRLLAVLITSARVSSGCSATRSAEGAARAVACAFEGSAETDYEHACAAMRDASGLDVFGSGKIKFDANALKIIARHLLAPSPDAPIERLFFETMPLSWLGSVYQRLLAFRPDETGEHIQASRSYRKGKGVFFTPSCLVDYIIDGVLSPIVEARRGLFRTADRIRILDPSMGGGDFLSRAIEFFRERDSESGVRAAAECVYGVDVDPVAVEVARFGVWASAGFADGISEAIKSHLICANALGTRQADEAAFDWAGAFPEAFAEGGFDAVVGNPPYIAAKNGLGPTRSAGQSDSYLMFVSEVIKSHLVRVGGLFSMVLPDPMLVRENAASIRRRFVTDWSVESILHISEAFPDALVANVVPICRNAPPTAPTFLAARIERAGDRRSFMLRPRRTALEMAHPVRLEMVAAQDRCEFLYLLEHGAFGEIIRSIHGESTALSNYVEPFVPLRRLNVRSIYRGEEVGKSAINRETGDQPVLLGGQSIQPYEIMWEGRTANVSWVKKPLERYHSTKILIQKSSPRIIAALDRVSKRHPGYVFPQSVYAVELEDPGMDPLYLLCILNSRVMNEYVWRAVTGYKLLQPQLEIEDIRALPIRRINFMTDPSERELAVMQGIGVFESEAVRVGEFPQLANFVGQCLTGTPERSDVVHDILVHLGREIVTLTRAGRKSPDADATRRLQAARTAVETVVWKLYCSEPAQMALQW